MDAARSGSRGPARRLPHATATAWCALLAFAAVAAVQADTRLRRIDQVEVMTLKRLIDRVVAGSASPGGDAWLKWSNHFLKGSDGKTYVPFTVSVEEAPEGFESVALYVRVVPEAAEPKSGGPSADLTGVAIGEVPVSVPERQFKRQGEPTAGEAAAVLQALSAPPRKGFPFEEAYPAVRESSLTRGEPLRIQRALAVEPGRYIVYAVVRERLDRKAEGKPKTAVLKRELVVPDFSEQKLQTSSIMLAHRVEMLDKALSRSEQALRPYAFGVTEIVPAVDMRFERSDALSVTFFVYNAQIDAAGMPDVAVEYRVYRDAGGLEKLVASAPAAHFNAQTLPNGFSMKAGHQLAPTQTLLLQSLDAGPYRLRVRVVDNRTGDQLFEQTPFIVQ
jgi:hypothetical protein